MEPLFRETQNKKFIEVIGHYDNPILCAKLTLLADLYAVEHREGYALFKTEDYDKLSKIDDSLKFNPPLEGNVYVDGQSIRLLAVNLTWASNLSNGFTEGTNNQVLYNGKVIYYNGVAVLTTNNVVENGNYLTIADLTGTNWVLNSSLDNTSVYSNNITFVSNGNTYNVIQRSYEPTLGEDWLDYGSMSVYVGNSWEDQVYRIIFITGGTDATNTNLITWLQSNATQVPVSDLSGTEWVFNSSIMGERSSSGYQINFNCNSQNYIGLRPIWQPSDEELGIDGLNRLYYMQHDETLIITTVATGQTGTTQYPINSWTDQAYRTISITNGTEATNPNLIAWLSQNATYQEPTPTGNTYELIHSLTNLTHGNITLQITPDTNYTYPTSLTISNGTLVSYDNTIGIVVISGDDTTIVSGECVEQPSGYEVQITFQNAMHANDWYSTEIYDDYYGYDISGNKIGEITSANGTITVTTTTGKISIKTRGSFAYFDGTPITTGGISNYSFGGNFYLFFDVSGNGTIVVDGIDYDY